MPNKYPEKKGWNVPKQKYKVTNWSDYNQALCSRGDIEVWLSDAAIKKWYEKNRVYDGAGAPKMFSDFSITVCHEIRQVYRLPLRQCQGFINSLFRLKNIPLTCPDYSTLSKRLSILGIKSPRYKKNARPDETAAAIAIDSTGLKRFGRGEWHQEKHKISPKRSWHKLHIAVDDKHIIHGCDLTDRFIADCQTVETLSEQIDIAVGHVTADGAYDKNPVYENLSKHFGDADIVIPPSSNAVYNKNNHKQRNRSLQEIKTFGRMAWQRIREYGRRNYSELAIQRYKKTLGDKLHARELSRQKNEAMIGSGILNRMTGLGMPQSCRCA